MKLISCHIENFGTLQGITMDFSAGLNCQCRENGWGKSTLSAFLTAMFYGFEGEAKRSIAENERKRFAPWQGGVYGGRIRFEAAGNEYIIYRTFGKKRSEDTLEVKNAVTGLPSDRYAGCPGEELFGIDRTSFEQTIQIRQSRCGSTMTDNIRVLLGSADPEEADGDGYETAMKILTEEVNHLNPGRKTGSIYRLQEQTEQCRAQFRRAESLPGERQECLSRLAAGEHRLEELLKQQEQLQVELGMQLERRQNADESRPSDRSGTKTENGSLPLLLILGIAAVAAGALLCIKSPLIGVIAAACGVFLIRSYIVLRKNSSGGEDETVDRPGTEKRPDSDAAQQLRDRLNRGKEEIERLQNEQYRLKRQAELLDEEEVKLGQQRELLQKLEMQLERQQRRYRLVRKTMEHLDAAREQVVSEYTEPLQEAFGRYYKEITGEEADRFSIDINGAIFMEAAGLQREAAILSSGYQDLLALCLRFALIDVMYRGEKPFLILDDPLVHLDEKRQQKALRLISLLSERYQVLYFTCSGDRIC